MHWASPVRQAGAFATGVQYYPSGATRQVEVDDNGWITALNNEVGASTRYT